MRPLLRLPLCLALLASSLHAAEINVFAAASLADALREVARTYEPASGDKIKFNLAASSVLARQIQEGAPADIFFSADEAKMNDLAQAGLVAPTSRRSLLSNTLVVVVPIDSTLQISNLSELTGSNVAKLALAEPQTVPAGVYTRAHLVKLGLWEQVAPKVIPTENVRACLAVVESGNVTAGIVYKTDALLSKKVRIALEIPAAGGPKISYPLAVIKGAKQPDAAAAFVAYLASSDAKTVFDRYGFGILP